MFVHEKKLNFGQSGGEGVVQIVTGFGHDPQNPVEIPNGAFPFGISGNLSQPGDSQGMPQGQRPCLPLPFPLLYEEGGPRRLTLRFMLQKRKDLAWQEPGAKEKDPMPVPIPLEVGLHRIQDLRSNGRGG